MTPEFQIATTGRPGLLSLFAHNKIQKSLFGFLKIFKKRKKAMYKGYCITGIILSNRINWKAFPVSVRGSIKRIHFPGYSSIPNRLRASVLSMFHVIIQQMNRTNKSGPGISGIYCHKSIKPWMIQEAGFLKQIP